ncbi:hypothetical protein [Bacillus sonorensis]|nr:hypothetical protein [Bacillus sonorensis]MCY7858675.1 hypothetical protein [Bacillus sonorensis]MCY8271424.1 hypothetical protein [Bacillus sonorensis]MCY8562188.1 hypothetical protein [Bacillus sonorensis]MCY8603960.1 hypothetical protein [Bacillus sonorensis]
MNVIDKESWKLRSELRKVLKAVKREELLASWYEFPWSPRHKELFKEAMTMAHFAMARKTDEQLINMILDRDVEKIVKARKQLEKFKIQEAAEK